LTSARLIDDPASGHNRWHPAIAPIATVRSGETITVRTRDGDDGQVTPETTSADLARLQPTRAHPMTGPFHIEGAARGDQLRVTVLDLEPDDFGWTTILPGRFGVLADHYESPLVVRWNLEDGVARSSDLPGVGIPAAPFLGLIGTAPSPAGLAAASAREAALVRAGGNAALPDPRWAVPGDGPAARDGLRTVPPRESGGNLDIKELGVGATITLPVEVDGALLSLGDMHFAQGDGESSGTAIECAGTATVRVDLVTADAVRWRGRFPHFEFVDRGRPHLATIGLSLTPDGQCADMDITVAVRAALLEMESYLTTVHGFSSGQAHVIVSTAVDVRLSSVVNIPTAVVSACLPLDVFDRDAPDAV
jgi:formamidase